MSILVDTSVWVDHLRRGNDRLAALLEAGDVLCHPAVIGEPEPRAPNAQRLTPQDAFASPAIGARQWLV